jgi:hypothetical protein
MFYLLEPITMKTKKVFFNALMACTIAITMMPSCGSSRSAVSSSSNASGRNDQDEEIANLQRQAKLEEARADLDAAKRRRAAEERRSMQMDAMEETIEEGAQMQLVPCQDDALDRIGQWMGGLGIGEDSKDQQAALKEASDAAHGNMEDKFRGTINNILVDYRSKTNTPSGDQSREAKLEAALRTVGSHVLNKYANVVCQKLMRTKRGTYRYYVATRIPTGTFEQEVAKELDVLKVDYNKNALLKSMDEQLNKQVQSDAQQREQMVQQAAQQQAQQ